MISPRSISPILPAGLLLAALLLLAAMGGCLPSDRLFTRILAESDRNPLYTARLNGFLALKDLQGPALRLEVEALEVVGDELAFPLTGGPLKIDSAELGAGQLYLGGAAVPPGRFRRLRMKVNQAEVQKADGGYAQITKEPLLVEFNLPDDLNLEPEDSHSLLVTWDVHNSLETDNSLALDWTVVSPFRELLIDLLFVSCPDIDTVFVVRADKNWVVDSFGVKGQPTYLAIDPDLSRQRLYVLASRERTVKVVDLSSYRVIDFFPAPLNDVPTFMTITPDGQWAFLLDERSGYLSRMDLTTGRMEARVLLGYRPSYATYLEEQNLLAVSLSLSQKVLLLDPVRLSTLATIPAGSSPQGLAVVDNQLYIAERGDNTVSITDLDSRASQSRLAVGLGPRRVLESGNQIYVSNYDDGSLSVLLAGQGGGIREIYGLGRPQEMADDKFFRRLYVSDEDAAALAVVDTNSNMLLGNIFLGGRPLGLDVIQ